VIQRAYRKMQKQRLMHLANAAINFSEQMMVDRKRKLVETRVEGRESLEYGDRVNWAEAGQKENFSVFAQENYKPQNIELTSHRDAFTQDVVQETKPR